MRYTARVFVIISRFKQTLITHVSHDIQDNILPVAPFYPYIHGGVIQIVTHSVCKQTFEWYCRSHIFTSISEFLKTSFMRTLKKNELSHLGQCHHFLEAYIFYPDLSRVYLSARQKAQR